MKYIISDVRVSELLTKQVSCPPWEVPILATLHGDNVKEVGEEEVDRDPPSPEDEYQRLCNKYRGNKEDANSVVAMIYGPYEAGIQRIAEEMRAAGIDVQPRGRAGRRNQAPVERSSRMSKGVRTENQSELDAATLRTAGIPGRSRGGVAPSNADPALGQDIGQQSKQRRQERQQAAQQQSPQQGQLQGQQRQQGPQQQGLQGNQQRTNAQPTTRPTLRPSRAQAQQGLTRSQPTAQSTSAAQSLDARKVEARAARERFERSQSSRSATATPPVRPR